MWITMLNRDRHITLRPQASLSLRITVTTTTKELQYLCELTSLIALHLVFAMCGRLTQDLSFPE